MGHAILYCTVCQRQLREVDFESGAAVKAEMNAYCTDCLPEGMTPDSSIRHTPPPATRRKGTTSTRIPLPGQTPPPPSRRRSGKTSDRIPVIPDAPRATNTRRAVVAPRKNRSLMWMGAVAGVVLLGIVVVLTFSSSGDAPEPYPTPRPARVSTIPPKPGPQTVRPQEVAPEKKPTAESIEKEFRLLEIEFRDLLKRNNFRAAQKILMQARDSKKGADWERQLGGLDREIADASRKRLSELMTRAKSAAEAQDLGVVGKSRKEITAWGSGFEVLLSEFDKEFGETLATVPPKPVPAPAAVPDTAPPPAKTSPYTAPWEKAMFLASRLNFENAAAALKTAGNALEDEDLKKENSEDLARVERLKNLHAEILAALPELPASEKLSVEFIQESGEPRSIKSELAKAGAHRFEFRSRPRFVEYRDLSTRSLAKIYTELKKDALDDDTRESLALLAAIGGDGDTAAELLGDARDKVPQKYWDYAESGIDDLPPLDPERQKKKWEVRKLFYTAENEFLNPKTRGAALAKYQELLKTHASTPFVERSRYEIGARMEAGNETLFPAKFLTGGGIFKSRKVRGKYLRKDLTVTAWTSPDEPLIEDLIHAVEFEFYARANQEYRGWVLLGGCCKDTFAWLLQGTELSYYDRQSRQNVVCDPNGDAAMPWSHKIRLPLIGHAGRDHQKAEKKPDRWAWGELPLPKYASPELKKIRLIGLSKGMAVGPVLVSSVRKKPLDPEEMAKLEEVAPPVLAAAGTPQPEEWLVLGPFDGASIGEALPPESEVKLKYETSVRNGPTQWKLSKVETTEINGSWKAKVDFHQLGITTRGVAYAMIHLEAPEAMDLKFHYSHDDDMRLWINGRLAFEEGKWALNRTTTIRVEAGWNQMLFKIWDNGKAPGQGAFLMEARFTDASDKPIPGLSFDPYGPMERE